MNLEFKNLMQETCEALSGVLGDKLDQVWLYGSYARKVGEKIISFLDS